MMYRQTMNEMQIDSMPNARWPRLSWRSAFMIVTAMAAVACWQLAVDAFEVSASNWAVTQNAAMRLIAGGQEAKSAVFRAGIEIKLANDYKTYWRSPGDSGVPPAVDFSGSQNVARAELLFPMPEIFEDVAGRSIGYKHHVIFPVHVEPIDKSAPVTLNVKISYGVCDKVCIPAEGQASLTLPARATSDMDELLRASEAHVPVKASIGGAGDLRIVRIGKPFVNNDHVSFEAIVERAEPVDLLADTASADWFLDVAKGPPQDGGSQRFEVSIFDPQSGKNRVPCDIRLTAKGKKAAIEVPVRLDGCIEAP